MQLQNLLKHKKNTSVCVNGRVYLIAEDLIIRDATGKAVDVPQVDADKLLTNRDAWRPVNGATGKLSRPEAKAGLKVILGDNSRVTPEVRPEDVTKPALEVSAVMAAQDAFEAKKQVETPKDPPIPKSGEDWADPTMDCSLAWLQACAKAYKIKIPKNKDKAALITKIKDAMYE